ncbi:P-loop containing nucleoside triphosphate hydrolase protein [Aspergillus egyptiacus]|nr:P-loop containing nucleoside triphosphate hydrolase protein [Aspergillus egyptiacus]
MASVFTYDPDPPRVSSPWSTSGSSTPQVAVTGNRNAVTRNRSSTNLVSSTGHDFLSDYGITKLDPEPQEGPTEYKLHLLLRPRRPYTSISTGHLVGGSYQSRTSLSVSPSGPAASSLSMEEPGLRFSSSRTTESRQQRLQQLTTQLLWRLQQSSPFHSSTTANLVLPILPEATPILGATPKPSRLLPGLEESQGALYEIGVADDGTFVGLTQDELEESLSNLQAMAASLGCKAEVLRRVVVGNCEWVEDSNATQANIGKVHAENLWVAEALVSPDWDYYRIESPKPELLEKMSASGSAAHSIPEGYSSSTEQIRISIAGPNGVGKSSLLGTLTSSVLDNGRGTSRLGLLKHRHEISSGVTSSVAHELIGYAANDPSSTGNVEVINYASGNVAAWDDIHAASEGGRLAFVSDLPGSVRYLKSTLRGLVSWAPHYVFLCLPATCEEEAPSRSGLDPTEQPMDMNLALSYLELCVKLDIPVIVVITKMDLASRAGLRNNLAKVLSALKISGRKPAMLPVQPRPSGKPLDLRHVRSEDAEDVKKLISATDEWCTAVPIVLTSAVDGSGIGKLHVLLRNLPVPSRPALRAVALTNPLSNPQRPANVFDVDEVFAIPPSKVYSEQRQQNHGVVLCGLVRYGSVSVGDELVVGPVVPNPQADTGNSPVSRKARVDQASQCGSYRSRPASGDFSSSFPQSPFPGKSSLSAQVHWQRVRVVSVRNLRLPVQKLIEDQVGTIGIEPLSPAPGEQPPLGKIRKGAILASLSIASSSFSRPLSSAVGFVASFPFLEFSSPLSPPVLLGGNAIVYIANVRTTVKLTCMSLAGSEIISSPPSPTEPEFFSFDADYPKGESSQKPEVSRMVNSSGNAVHDNIDITFSFVTSVEWLEVGSKVLLVPGASTALSSAEGSNMLSGLEGFVGRVREVLYTDEDGSP